MLDRMSQVLGGSVLAVALAMPAGAGASVELKSVSGDVQAGTSDKTLLAARAGQRLAPGTTVVTGDNAGATLNFEDGQRIVLGPQTHFRVVDYRYVPAQPVADRAVFDLVKGALRVITGLIGQRSRDAFAMRTPQVTIGVRGTDFMVSVINGTHIEVVNGAVAASNGAGMVAFGPGSTAVIPASSALPASVASAPQTVQTAFAPLRAINPAEIGAMASGGPATGAAPAAGGAAAGGIGTGGMIGIGAAAAAALGAAGGGGGGNSTATHH